MDVLGTHTAADQLGRDVVASGRGVTETKRARVSEDGYVDRRIRDGGPRAPSRQDDIEDELAGGARRRVA